MAAAGKVKAPTVRPARSGTKKVAARKAPAKKAGPGSTGAASTVPVSRAAVSKAAGSKAAGSKSTPTKIAAGAAKVDGEGPARPESVVRPRNVISVLARKRLAGRHGVTPKGQRRQMNQAVKQLVDDED